MNSGNIMPKINGKSFRCDCGCNVFHHPKESPEKYECNACGAWYIGEKSAQQVIQAELLPSDNTELSEADLEWVDYRPLT